VELINHSDNAGNFDCSDGVGVKCTSSDEARVNYGSHDCWTMAMTYGFCAAQRRAHSLRTHLTFEGLEIHISRKFERNERINRVTVPIVAVDGNKVDFSFLLLGNIQRPRLPRTVFLHVAKSTPIKQPDELFDLIQHHNCVKLMGFLRVSDGLSMPMATTLRRAAYRQLETLSAHFGARSLEDDSGEIACEIASPLLAQGGPGG